MTTWLISGFFIFLLIAAGIHYKSKCRKEISAINAELENITKWLEKPRYYKDIDASFNNHKRLNPTWKNFKDSLTAEKYSTTDAAEFFNVTNLTRGINMTFWQGYGGIFTGLGILGTFAGLTVGLGGVVIPKDNDINVLRDSIAQLLSGVETAFVTSLVGIFFAIVYSWVHHNLLTKFQGNVQNLADNLDGQFKRRSAEDWLAENNATAQVQSKTLQSIDGQISVGNSLLEKSHGEAQAQSATLQSIGEQVAASNSLLEKSRDEAQAQSKTLQSIDGHISFGNSLLEKSHNEAQAQSKTLQNIGTNIDSQKTILQNIGEDVARAIYDGLDERMNTAVETLCDKLEEKLLPQVDRICAAIDKLGNGGSEAIGDIFAGKVGSQMERFSAALDKFSDNIDKKLENANEISKIMNEQLLNTLKDLDESLKQHAQASAKERADEYKRFTTTLEELISNLDKVADKIKANADEANEEVKRTTSEHDNQSRQDREQFLAQLASLIKTMNEVANRFKEQQIGHLENFEMLINILLTDLKDFADRQQKFLDKIANANAAQISESVKAFREIVDNHNATIKKTFGEVQTLLNETETFLYSIDTASNTLKQAATPVKESSLQLSRNLTETSAQMKTLATANQTTRDNLAALSTRLADFVTKFNGIADELERATDIIGRSLDNYNVKTSKELSDALTKFGNTMAQVLGELDGIVSDFSETVGYVKKNRR